MQIKPQHDWILVRITKPDAVTPGGLHLPASRSDGTMCSGTVLEHGPDGDIKNGDVVMFKREDAAEFDHPDGDGECAFLVAYEVIAVVLP